MPALPKYPQLYVLAPLDDDEDKEDYEELTAKHKFPIFLASFHLNEGKMLFEKANGQVNCAGKKGWLTRLGGCYGRLL